MNDAPLPADHGAPLRLLVPGWYGMASVKWLATIEVLTAPYVGQFQTKSYQFEWSDRAREAVTTMLPRALFTDPAPGDTLARGPYTVRGKAWSGAGPITAVEVSIDGAGEWLPARVAPPTGPYQWQEWSFDWAAPNRGGMSSGRARPTRRAPASRIARHGIASATAITPCRCWQSTCGNLLRRALLRVPTSLIASNERVAHMSTTTDFFAEVCRRGATPDRPFVDANEIAEQLGMNDEDLIAAIEALEVGNLIEEVDRGDQIAVRLTQEGIDIWKQQRGELPDR